jgi:hypothetical protein
MNHGPRPADGKEVSGTRADKEAVVVGALILGNAVLVGALSWWGWSLHEDNGSFLLVMAPTSIYALLTGVPLLRRWHRITNQGRS